MARSQYVLNIRLSILVIIALGCLWGCGGNANTTTTKEQQRTSLTLSATTVDFSSVTVGSSSTKTLTVSNQSSASVIVNDVTVSGTGFSLTGATLPATLAVGDSITLNLKFAPTAAGAMTGSVVIASDATIAPPTISLSGTGVSSVPAPTLGVSPSSLSFGTVTTGNSKPLTLTLSNPSSTATITVHSASITGSDYRVSGTTFPLVISAKGSEIVTVTFAPTATGTASGSLVISSDASNDSVTVKLSGTGQSATAALTVSPTSLNFGDVTVGTTSAGKSVVLTNNATGAAITVNSASFSGSEYKVSGATFPFTLATGGGTKTLTVTFTPAASGTANDSLSIVSNASNSPTAVSVTGVGQAPPAHQVDLTWTASTSTVVGYFVYRSNTKGGPYSQLNSTADASTSFTDTKVTAGKTYYYVVTAIDSSDLESNPSNEASVTVPSP